MPVLALVAAYLIGGIPFGYLVVRWKTGADVRAAGSGNIGATNVLRTTGRATCGGASSGNCAIGSVGIAMTPARMMALPEIAICQNGEMLITGSALVIDGGLTLGLPLAAAQFGSTKPVKRSSLGKGRNARTQ